MLHFISLPRAYVYGHLAFSSAHIPVSELVRGEKATSPRRNAEEPAAISRLFPQGSPTTGTSVWCVRGGGRPRRAAIMEIFLFSLLDGADSAGRCFIWGTVMAHIQLFTSPPWRRTSKSALLIITTMQPPQRRMVLSQTGFVPLLSKATSHLKWEIWPT